MFYDEIQQDKKVYSITAEKEGYFDLNNYRIDLVQVNGEMAYVYWYRLINKEGKEKLINGKYVISVEFC